MVKKQSFSADKLCKGKVNRETFHLSTKLNDSEVTFIKSNVDVREPWACVRSYLNVRGH